MVRKKSNIVRFEDVRDRIVTIRGQEVILDFAVAELYGVETKEVNRAVKNNPLKFPNGWVFELRKEEFVVLKSNIFTAKANDNQELADLRWKNFTTNLPNSKSRVMPKAFTERGLYMLATVLKGDQAINTTLTIVDTFAQLHELKRTIAEMAKSPDEYQQKTLMQKSGDLVDNLFGDSFATNETETEIELNFAVLKLKHTIKRKKQDNKDK